jgi:hypothetical protein
MIDAATHKANIAGTNEAYADQRRRIASEPRRRHLDDPNPQTKARGITGRILAFPSLVRETSNKVT